MDSPLPESKGDAPAYVPSPPGEPGGNGRYLTEALSENQVAYYRYRTLAVLGAARVDSLVSEASKSEILEADPDRLEQRYVAPAGPRSGPSHDLG